MSSQNASAAATLLSASDALADAAEAAGKAVVAIHGRPRIPSSGVHWREGLIVTASHTIKREESIVTTLHDGSTADARLVGRDRSTDIAVLRLDGAAPPLPRWGGSDSLRVGQLVLALGRPWDGGITAALGVIAALAGEWRTWRCGRVDRLIRLDLAVQDGFSGGPLVDADGRIVGVNTSTLLRGTAATVPAETVHRAAEQALEKGDVRRAYLGVAMHPVRLPESVRAAHGLPGGAALLILLVEPGGPAERAGLILGDVLIDVAGEPVKDAAHVLGRLGSEQVDKPLAVRVLRGGKPLELEITPGPRPEPGEE
jgi:S1-C subfamily serine protease